MRVTGVSLSHSFVQKANLKILLRVLDKAKKMWYNVYDI